MSNSTDFEDPDQELPMITADQPLARGRKSGGEKGPGFGSRLAGTIRDRGSKRMLFVMIGIPVVVMIYAFWPHNHKIAPSRTLSAPKIDAAQGSAPPSPVYKQDLLTSDAQRAEQAAETGTSAMPTIMANPAPPPPVTTNLPSVNGDTQDTTDDSLPQPTSTPALPTAALPTLTNPASVAPQKKVQTASTYVVDDSKVTAIAQYMVGLQDKPQAAEVDDDFARKSAGNLTLASDTTGQSVNGSTNGQVGDSTNASATNAATTSSGSTQASDPGPFAEPVPGTILYSTMTSAVDSDDPGPILAQIQTGALKGARLIGAFSTHTDGVVITFTTATIPYLDADGNEQTEVLPINAVAVSTSNLSDSLATSVNDHLALKLGVSFLTSFMNGFGQLLSESNAQTTVSSTGTIVTSNPALSTKDELLAAGGEAAGTAGQVVSQEFGNLPPTIKVAAGTPFGLLFTSKGTTN